MFEDKPVTLTVPIKGSLYGLTYQWYRWDEENDKDVIIDGETANELTVTEEGDYSCKVSFAYDEDESQWASFSVRKEFPEEENLDYYGVSIGGVWYELIDSANESLGADASLYEAQGAVTIPANVKLSNGKVYPVRTIYGPCPEATSISIPNTVTTIIGEVGLTDCDFDEDENLISYKVIPGFVIFGKTGSAAQTYAKKYGIKFRDLAAEKEAARQGTSDKSLPKVKIAKPKAAKKAATIKWKKLNKKQLKNSKVQKIEVWVCPNGSFGANDTVMKTAGKKKASLKVKGLKKGTYFVKVRAIKYVNGTKMVGPWSNVKKVKIKK